MFQVQNALRSFVEVSENLPEELKALANFSQNLDPTDDTGRTMAEKEFVLVSQNMGHLSISMTTKLQMAIHVFHI